MTKAKILVEIEKPELEDYDKKYASTPCNTPKKLEMFELITTPEHIYKAINIVTITNSSPIRYYSAIFQKMIETGKMEPLSRPEKQIVGKIVCVVMEANGYSKADGKQKFTKGVFGSGRLYKKDNN